MSNSPQQEQPAPPQPSQDNQPQSPPRSRGDLGRRTKIAIALASVAAIGAGAYMGAKYLIGEKLYPMVETEASKFLEREVKLGKLQSFSLNGVRIGPVSIPPTATDPDKLDIEAIDMSWQLLPLLGGTLPLRVTLVKPELYVEQDELGEWIDLQFLEKLPPGDPPPVDATLNIQKGSIALLPHTATTPVSSEINGRARYKSAQEEIEYDIDADIATGKVSVEGETLIETGESDLSAKVENFSLIEINPFIPNAMVAIASGQLNADLKAQLPSFQELPSVKGNLNLQSLEIQVPELPHPVNASAQLYFQGKTVLVEEIKTCLGANNSDQNSSNNPIAVLTECFALETLVSGKVDLDRGYDIAVAVAPVSLPELLEVAAVESPVELDGEMQLDLSVTGEIENPEINGILKSNKMTRIDKLEIAQIEANFGGDRTQAVLKDLQIIPQAGGGIRGKGQVKLSADSGEFLEPEAMPLSFEIDAQLPVDEIARPYNLPPDISISNLTAQAQVQGTIAQPEGKLQWQAPGVAAVGVSNISGGGEVTLIDNQVQLRNNRVQIGAGILAIGGEGNLETGNFQASVRAKAVPVDPFIGPDVPRVTLSNGTVKLAGNFNSPEIDKIEGGTNLSLNIAGERAVVNGNLKDGFLQVKGSTAEIQLDKFIPDLPVAANLLGSSVDLLANLKELLASTQGIDYNSINANANVRLGVEDGIVNANSTVKGGIVDVAATTSTISLNSLLRQFLPETSLPVVNLLASQVNIRESLDNIISAAESGDYTSIDPTANAKVRLEVGSGTVNTTSRVNAGRVDVAATSSRIELTPFLQAFLPETAIAPVILESSKVNISESLKGIIAAAMSQEFSKINPRGNAEARLRVNDGTVKATSRVNAGRVNVTAETTDKIELTPFLQTLLPETSLAAVTLESSEVNISESLNGIIAAAMSQDFSKINPRGNAEARLRVNDGTVRATSTVNAGRVKVETTTSQIELTPFLQDLAVPVTLLASEVNLSESFQAIASAAVSQDFTQLDPNATANVNLKVAEGTVNGSLSLADSKWQTNVTASQVQVGEVLEKLGIINEASKSPLPLKAEVNISGNLDPLVNPQIPSTIKADKISVQLAEQSLEARGTAVVSNLTTAARSVGLELNIDASSDLDAIPFTELLSMAPVERDFLPTQLNIGGDADFEGRLLAKNLLLDPLTAGNLNLTGDLQLRDFAFNEMKFDPLLTGPVNVDPAREIGMNLRGKKDVISAQLTPCIGSACMAPYLPASLSVRQGDGENTFLVRGRRTGDIFKAKIENFALDLLKISPGDRFGIPGAIEGMVNGEVEIDLATLATEGNIKINQLGLGNRVVDRLATDFYYNNNIAELKSGILQLQEIQLQESQDQQYQFNGELNLNTGEVKGKVDIKQASVQDILEAVKLPSLQQLQEIFAEYQPPTANASAADVQTLPVGNPEAPVFSQLRQLDQSNAIAIARPESAAEMPIYLNISGDYSGDITLAGTLTNPEIDVNLQGQDWQWRPYQPLASSEPSQQNKEAVKAVPAEPPLDNRVITVDQWIAQGSLKESGQKLGGFLKIEKLSLDTVGNFAEIPIDIKGNLNATATLSGSMAKPQVGGTLSFADVSIDDRPLDEIQGKFAYDDNRLNFNTTQPSYLQVQASVPFPIVPGNNRAEVEVQLDTEAIALIGLFSQGQVEWVDGEGKVELQASGNLDLEAQNIKNLQAVGNVTLKDATIKSKAVSEEPLIFNGAIALTEKHLQVENIEGNFAESKIEIAGVLPIFESNPDSDKPLEITIDKGKLNLNGLYKGQIDTDVTISGSALSPVIAGKVALSNGRVTVPLGANGTQPAANSTLTSATMPSAPADLAIAPEFQDFQVILGEDFYVKRNPQLDFKIDGDVTVNGTFRGSPEDLQPKGNIYLRRGIIDVLNNKLLLSRDYDSKISFIPTEGLLNPNLDILTETTVIESANNERSYQRSERSQYQDNEIPDNSVGLTRPDEINIKIAVRGNLEELLPADYGQLNPCQDPLPNFNLPTQGSVSTMTAAELKRLAGCLKESQNEQERQLLLDREIVKITSVPTRSEAEILALLSNQSADLVQQLAQSNEKELLLFAVSRYAIEPFVRNIVFGVEDTISNAGQKLGFANLRIFPIFEGFYHLNNDSLVRIIYDYEFNEINVQYENRF
ncbi:MAG: DUF748 domain-containing protein [Hormoscilla sp.]